MGKLDISRFASSIPSLRPRDVETVTAEILDIKQRIGEDFLELGRRLIEAKDLLPHGEWLPWLRDRAEFSERTAQKFMTLAREYESNPQLAADLGSEKAFALLALPPEDRERILTEGAEVGGKTKPVADLSKAEIRELAREKKRLAKTKPAADLPEGQLIIAGWIPGGITPAEPGEFAVLVDLGHKLHHRFFHWTGRAWEMQGGIRAELEPIWWLRLPPVPEKGD